MEKLVVNNSSLKNKWTSSDSYFLTGFIFLALVIRIIFYTGLFGSDEFVYTNMALNILKGEWDVSNYIGATRYGVNLPVAAFMKLFGVSEFSANFWSLLTSVMEVALVFVFSRHLFGLRAAFLSALMIIFLPLHVHIAGRLLADAPLAFFITLSFFLFWLAEKKNSTLLFIATGIAIGSVFWIKEVVLAFSMVFVLYPIVFKKWNPKWLLMIAAAAFMIVLNCLFFFIISGDFFHIFNVIQNAMERSSAVVSKRREALYYFNYLFVDIRHTWLLGYLVVLGAFFYLKEFKKDINTKHLYFIFIWGGGLLSLLSFMVSPSGTLVSKQTNYMLIFIAPLCILAGYGLSKIKPSLSAMICSVFIAGSLILSALEQQAIRVFAANSYGIIEFAKENQTHPVYVSSRAYIITRISGKLHNQNTQSNIIDLDEVNLTDRTGDQASNPTNNPATYLILDRETMNAPYENQAILISSNCWRYYKNITPTGFGIGQDVLGSIRYIADLVAPDSIANKVNGITDPYYLPKPAEIYQSNDNC